MYNPPFLQNKKFLRLGNHVRESGSPAYLRLLKTLPIDFSSQKPTEVKFQVILTL